MFALRSLKIQNRWHAYQWIWIIWRTQVSERLNATDCITANGTFLLIYGSCFSRVWHGVAVHPGLESLEKPLLSKPCGSGASSVSRYCLFGNRCKESPVLAHCKSMKYKQNTWQGKRLDKASLYYLEDSSNNVSMYGPLSSVSAGPAGPFLSLMRHSEPLLLTNSCYI